MTSEASLSAFIDQPGTRREKKSSTTAEEIIEYELAVAPDLVPIFEALTQARRDILARIAALDGRIRAGARRHATVRLLMTAPGVRPVTALAVAAASPSDQAGRHLKRKPRVSATQGITCHWISG